MKYNPHIKRIMLIFPPASQAADYEPMVTVPMGLAYLGAALQDEGYEVICLDALAAAPYQVTEIQKGVTRRGLTYDQIMERIKAEKPDLVGLSCIFSNQWPAVRELSRRIKELDPEIIVLTGGAHPTFLPELCLKDSQVDFILRGEAEHTLLQLLERLRGEKPFADIDGIAFREKGEPRVNPKRSFIENLDALPFPALELFDLETYFKTAMPMGFDFRHPRTLPVITSRGCPCSCTFCSSHHLWGKRYRTRSPENVLKELDRLYEKWGVRDLKFQDDNLTVNRKRAEQIFQGMIARGYQLHWNTPNGIAVWTLDENLLRLMKRSGCYQITMAIESGDQEVLSNIIKKPLRLEKAREVNEAARRVGIERWAYFMIGLPGETKEQIMNTIRFARELKLENAVIFIYNPLPGSELFEECLRRGYIREDDFFEAGNAYFSSVIDSEHWTARELETLIRREYLRNYLAIFRSPRLAGRRYLTAIRYRPSVIKFTAARIMNTLGGKAAL